ncbi:leukotoxin LktA family filamentous adhesin [Marinobacterium sediminicola]|uniref:Haemagglutination activity domain-containing protein n=1 Tax=Marinobacterium sediminicola TaxID=518898 RepID=A0ABY1S1E9_9GAMM|nr:leukotoxin LktA family filamentous adhesin [Marinobacterium sediminicola]ULG69835.1 leukotoxin LktA family filamentous adhesin [Marinobacterium sediminicola]SMR75350.1 haemagglutination activity domain-containing protein [Marinobacterium sediminicola]
MARAAKRRRGGLRQIAGQKFTAARSTLAAAVAAALGAGISPLWANTIVVDGRTDTRLNVNGNVTDVVTGTVRGANGFNSFHHFNVAAGNTVNLHVPSNAQNLINLVHDSRAVIDGTLNGVKNGNIDGHIVFADPHGVVVGANGVINVGSLMLAAPTSEFMDRMISAEGAIDEAAVSDLLAGTAPVGDGQIRIDGKVNALDAVHLGGRVVVLDGTVEVATDEAHQALFEAAVNTEGLAVASGASLEAGNIVIHAADDVVISGVANVSAPASGEQGGHIRVRAGRDVSLNDGAVMSVAGADSGGSAGVIDIWADRDATVSTGVRFDASAGATGDGGFIEVSAARTVTLDGLNADLGAGAGGEVGEFLIDPVTVNAGSTAYYTNGGNVTIVASDTITLAENAVINTRQILDPAGDDKLYGDWAAPGDNPFLLPADSETVASIGRSGNVTLQAPNITIEAGARINTFATDGYDAGDISLLSGDNFTCNICEAPSVGDYFTDIDSIGSPIAVASTDDVSISIAEGAVLDARYLERSGYMGAAGADGNIEISAEASDLQVAGWSQASASVVVNGMLRGGDINVTASANAGVDFSFLAALDPANPTGTLTLMEEISDVEFDQIHADLIENADDPTDLTNLLGVGLPITAGIAHADAKVEIGNGAVLEASGEINVSANAERSVNGASGGLLAGSIPNIGIGAIYGQVSGETTAIVSGNARLTTTEAVNVTAFSKNELEVGAEAQVEAAKTTSNTTQGNSSAAFALAIGRARVNTTAGIGESVVLDAGDVDVHAAGMDDFSTEAQSIAIKSTKAGAPTQSQGALTVAISDWKTGVDAYFDARLAAGEELESLDVIAQNLSVSRSTRASVQTGNNFFDYLLGSRSNRQSALDGLLSGAISRSGSPSSLRIAGAAAVTISEQTASARIGSGAVVNAAGDVAVRSRVIDQGIRNIADSRVNSTSGSDASQISGSVAFAFGEYNHASHALIGDGASVNAANIGVGARSLLPIDNDYDEALSDFDVTQWDGPDDFFGALTSLYEAVMMPDATAVESAGLADYLLTGYSNAYGTAEENAVFGSANILLTGHDTRAWVGEGATLNATGADAEWSSDFGIPIEVDDGEDPWDIDAAESWTWSAPVDVDAQSTTETIGFTGNLSILSLLLNRNDPSGNSVGGSFGWTQFDTRTIAGIGDGAVVRASALDVNAVTTDLMVVIAPSAGQGDSVAGNGIFSYAQLDGVTHASVHNGAHLDVGVLDILADQNTWLWAIGGAMASSSETSIGVAVAVDSISSDTRAWVGDNSADRVPEEGEDTDGDGMADTERADVLVADGSAAGILADEVNLNARTEGEVGAISVAGAVARSGASSSSSVGSQQQNTAGGLSSNTSSNTQNSGFLGSLQNMSQSFGSSSSAPTAAPSLTGAGSGTLNFSRINTVAEMNDVALLNTPADGAVQISVNAISDIDQISGSGAAALSLSGSGSASRSTAVAGAVAFNDIQNETRAGLYGVTLAAGGETSTVDVLAASSGDILSAGLALASSDGNASYGGAVSASLGMIDSDTRAEIENSMLLGNDSDLNLTGYDRSRILVGGGALYHGSGDGGGGVGLALTYGRIDNDVSAYIRGSELYNYGNVGVSALSASRVLAAAFGGAVDTGSSTLSGAGSVYVLSVDSDLGAGVTGTYHEVDDDSNPETPAVPELVSESVLTLSGDLQVLAASTSGTAELDSHFVEGGLNTGADFDGNVLAGIDTDQTGLAMPDLALPGEAVLGFAGSLAIGGDAAAAGVAVGYTELGGSYRAEILDADVTAAGAIDVAAINSRTAIGIAAGASYSDAAAITALGSGAITVSKTDVVAQVGGSSVLEADNIGVKAEAQGEIFSLAGALSATSSGTAAIGAAASYNEIGGTVAATLGGDRVHVTGSNPAGEGASVDVLAQQDADIRALAIAGGVNAGGTVAAAGSVTINSLTASTSAQVDASSVEADSLRVRAANGSEDNSNDIWSLAGSITVSNTAGFGLAFSFNTLANAISSGISGTTLLGTDQVDVSSDNHSSIKTLAVSGGGSGNISAGVSDASSSNRAMISAGLNNTYLERDTARVNVQAADHAAIDSLAGAVQGGGTGAVGAAAVVNDIANQISAQVSGGRLRVENLSIDASSLAAINTIAAGVAVGGQAGLAGSIAVNLMDTVTSAYIDSGADIEAQHNVGVVATNNDAVNVIAGSAGIGIGAVGGGLSFVINHMMGVTQAYIDGATTRVSALALDAADVISVATGDLTSEISATKLEEVVDFSPVNVERASHDVTGVAVNASSIQSVGALAVTIGVSGGASGAVTSSNNVIAGETSAWIRGGDINRAVGASEYQQLDLRASSHAYSANLATGVAASATGSGSGTLAIDTLSRRTSAWASEADLHATDRIDVVARTTLGTSMLSIGGAGGVAGIAGSGNIAVHDATTLAYFEGETDADTAQLVLDADARNRMTLVSGAVGIGVTGGGAGATNLAVSSLTTEAEIDSEWRDETNETPTGSGQLIVSGDTRIKANSDSGIENYAIGAAGGGTLGVAGSIGVNVVDNTTMAGMRNARLQGTWDSSLGIEATEAVTLSTFAGALGVGVSGSGVGAGAQVSVVHSVTDAALEHSSVQMGGDLDVLARSDLTSNAVSIAASGGASAGISGSVSVTLIGSGERGDADEEIDKDGQGTLSHVSDLNQAERNGDTAELLSQDQQEQIATSSAYDFDTAVSGTVADRTRARISGGSIVAANLNVNAEDVSRITNTVGAIAGGSLGFGGAVSISRSYSQVSALISDNASIYSHGDVSVKAVAGEAGDTDELTDTAVAGSAGMVALGAAVVDARIDNQVEAGFSARLQGPGSVLSVKAEDLSSVNAEAIGAQAGASAAGIVLANAGKTSRVDARIADATLYASSAREIELAAASSGRVNAHSVAAAGGILAAGSGSVATAIDGSDVDAGLYGANVLYVKGDGLNIDAKSRPEVRALAEGYNVAGSYSVGASVATAKVEADVDAVIFGTTTVNGIGDVELKARLEQVSGSGGLAWARATGASGGAALGANATVADARTTSHINTEIESGSTFNQQGDIQLLAWTDARQSANADGYSIGLVAAGANDAHAESSGTTKAHFAGAIGGSGHGDLSVRAISENVNEAQAEAGSGGLVAGAAASASTLDASSVSATLANSSAISVGDLTLAASHTTEYLTTVDSTRASLLGMSGGWSVNSVDADVTVTVAEDSVVQANNVKIDALGSVSSNSGDDFNVQSGSGGIFDFAGASSMADIVLNTLVDLGRNVMLGLKGDWTSPGTFTVQAANTLDLSDRVKLDAGGLIATAHAESRITANDVSATLNIAEGARLESTGDMVLASYNDADIGASANAKTYGVSGAAGGTSRIEFSSEQSIDVGQGAELLSWGDMRLMTGRDTFGNDSEIDLQAYTDLWNYTALPVGGPPVADVLLTRTGNIAIDSGARVASVGDVYLIADGGKNALTAQGTGKDLYRAAAEGIVNAIGSLVGAEEISLELKGGSTSIDNQTAVSIDGRVEAGIYHDQFLTLNHRVVSDGSGGETFEVYASRSSEGVGYTLLSEDYTQNLFERLNTLYAQQVDYNASAVEKAAFQAEIDLIRRQLEALGTQAGLTEAEMYPDGRDGALVIPTSFPIYTVELDDIIARPGNIEIGAQVLTGTGVLDAPGDASIEIINNTPAFLRTNDLIVPDRMGGEVRFNRALVKSTAEITALNKDGRVANFSEVNTAANSDVPQISVINSFNPTDLPGTLAPDVFAVGDVENRRGSVLIKSNHGSVIVDGSIRANSTSIGAGENVVLSYIDDFRHLDTDPAGLAAPDASGATVAGNSVIISARYINVNGLVQSGIPNWNLTISAGDATVMSQARTDFNNGAGEELVRIRESDPLSGTIGYRYDARNDRIVLDSVDVSGGYMELTGKIISTGNGELRVLDGYGRVSVNNETGIDLEIAGIDIGTEIEGRLRINDAGLLDGDDNNLTSTIYTRVGNSIQVYRGAFGEIDTTAEFLDSSLTASAGSRSTVYAPREGLDYIWLDGESYQALNIETRYSDTAIGFIPAGSGTLYSSETIPGSAEPRAIPGANYLAEGEIPEGERGLGNVYDWGVQDYESDGSADSTVVETWSTCESHFIVCLERRYWTKETTTSGLVGIHRRGMAADQDININFIGYDSGSINITSTLSDVLVGGSVLNESGTTTIRANVLDQLDPDAIISAGHLNVYTTEGIGLTQAMRTQISGDLRAASVGGDIRFDAVNGGLNIREVSTQDGDVWLRAVGDIRSGSSLGIKGGSIELTSLSGSINGAIQTGSTEQDVLAASAPGGINLLQREGDLWVTTLDAGASDVSVTLGDGDLLDGNTTASVDQRQAAVIEALWDDMDLTGTGADEALQRELDAQTQAGQTRYQRYWTLRNLSIELDESGQPVAYSSDAYDPDFRVSYGSSRIEALKATYGWSTPAEVEAGVARMEQLATDEYHALHQEFGTGAYDPNFAFVLSQDDIDAISQGHKWTVDQLTYSVAEGIARAPGQNTGVLNEDPNIVGHNVFIAANNVGKTLDETLVIDLTDGVRSLTTAERQALSTAEYDDVAIDPENPNVLTILRRDDVDFAASGGILVTAHENAFIGGDQDLNIQQINGKTIRIKTNGSILLDDSLSPGSRIRGTDLILEASSGNIGSEDLPLVTDLIGQLTARTSGSLYLFQRGDVIVDSVTALGGIWMDVVGDVTAARSTGATFNGGNVTLSVSGNLGSETGAVDITQGSSEWLNLEVSGDVWLGARQLNGAVGNLNFAQLMVGGDLTIANVWDVLLSDADAGVSGNLLMDLQNDWRMSSTSSLQSLGNVSARTGGTSVLSDIRLWGEANDFTLESTAIQAVGDGPHLRLNGALSLTATNDIGTSDAYLRVSTGSVNALSQNGSVYLDLLSDMTGGGAIAALGGEVSVNAAGDLLLDSLFGADGVNAVDQGTMQLGTLGSEAGALLSAVNDLHIGSADIVESLELNNGENLSFGTLIAGQNINGVAAGTITGDQIRTGLDLNLSAGGTLNVNQVASGRDALLSAVNDLHIGSADIVGSLALNTGENLSFGTLIAGQNINGVAAGIITGDQIRTGLDLNLRAGGSLDVNRIASGRDVTLEAESLNLGSLSAGADVALKTLEDIVIVSVDTLGALGLTAGGRIEFEDMEAGSGVTAAAGGSIIGRTVKGGPLIDMTAGVQWLDGESQPDVTEGVNLSIDLAEADSVSLRSGGVTRIPQVNAANFVGLYGSGLNTSVYDTDGDWIRLDLHDGHEGLADRISLRIFGDEGVEIDRLYAGVLELWTDALELVMRDVRISESMALQTPETYVWMNQLNPGTQQVDTQLYEPDQAFKVSVSGQNVETDAYVVYYRPGWTVSVPNFTDTHDLEGVLVGGQSVERTVGRILSEPESYVYTGSIMTPFQSPVLASSPVQGPVSGFAVRLDSEDEQPEQEKDGI